MIRIIVLLVTIVFIVFGLILGLLNPHSVIFDAYFTQTKIPLSILLAVFFIIGLLIGAILLLSRSLSIQWQNIRFKIKIKKQDNEIKALNLKLKTHTSFSNLKLKKP